MNIDMYFDSICQECGDTNGNHLSNCALHLTNNGEYSSFHCPVCKKVDNYELKHYSSCQLLPAKGRKRRVCNERTDERIKSRLDSKRVISPDELLDIQMDIQNTRVNYAHERLRPATIDDYRLYMRYRDPARNECFLCGIVTSELTCLGCKPRLRGTPFETVGESGIDDSLDVREQESGEGVADMVSDDLVAESGGAGPEGVFISPSIYEVRCEPDIDCNPSVGDEEIHGLSPRDQLVNLSCNESICQNGVDITTFLVVGDLEPTVSYDDNRSKGDEITAPCGNQVRLSGGNESESGISIRWQQWYGIVAVLTVAEIFDFVNYLMFRLLIYGDGTIDASWGGGR